MKGARQASINLASFFARLFSLVFVSAVAFATSLSSCSRNALALLEAFQHTSCVSQLRRLRQHRFERLHVGAYGCCRLACTLRKKALRFEKRRLRPRARQTGHTQPTLSSNLSLLSAGAGQRKENPLSSRHCPTKHHLLVAHDAPRIGRAHAAQWITNGRATPS